MVVLLISCVCVGTSWMLYTSSVLSPHSHLCKLVGNSIFHHQLARIGSYIDWKWLLCGTEGIYTWDQETAHLITLCYARGLGFEPPALHGSNRGGTQGTPWGWGGGLVSLLLLCCFLCTLSVSLNWPRDATQQHHAYMRPWVHSLVHHLKGKSEGNKFWKQHYCETSRSSTFWVHKLLLYFQMPKQLSAFSFSSPRSPRGLWPLAHFAD